MLHDNTPMLRLLRSSGRGRSSLCRLAWSPLAHEVEFPVDAIRVIGSGVVYVDMDAHKQAPTLRLPRRSFLAIRLCPDQQLW